MNSGHFEASGEEIELNDLVEIAQLITNDAQFRKDVEAIAESIALSYKRPVSRLLFTLDESGQVAQAQYVPSEAELKFKEVFGTFQIKSE